MGAVRNVLFIMCDQLRADYLSCMGHKSLQTPHIDALAADGVTFDRAYVQSPICGPSRMSFYTGRYTFSHGSTWNNVPLSVAEWTIGDYLRPLGVRTALAGKTHMAADKEGMARLAIDPQWKVCGAESEFDILCVTSQGDDEAKAKRIATALNNHKALVEALENLMAAGHQDMPLYYKRLAEARVVLEDAQGEST